MHAMERPNAMPQDCFSQSRAKLVEARKKLARDVREAFAIAAEMRAAGAFAHSGLTLDPIAELKKGGGAGACRDRDHARCEARCTVMRAQRKSGDRVKGGMQ
jgi:hypothetical protein